MEENEKLLIERMKTDIEVIKKELVVLIKEKSETYSDVEDQLSILQKQMIWECNRVMLAIIEDVQRNIEEEKNGLSVK